VFSIAVAVLALASGLLFAVMADRVVRGAAFYKTVLLLPYVIAGMLWLFLFNPSVGIVAAALRRADDARSRHGPSRQLFRRARSGDGRHQRPAGRGDDAEHPRHGVLPLIASATATLLFRQFFLTIPDELVEAAKIDGAGPWRFLIDMVIPLSRTNIAALFVILFIYGWNQYLWPLLVTNTRR